MTSNFGYLSILLLLKMLTYMNHDILFINKKIKGLNFCERNLIKRKTKFSLELPRQAQKPLNYIKISLGGVFLFLV